jgi:hypothetical protein
MGIYDNVLDQKTCFALMSIMNSGKYNVVQQTSSDYVKNDDIRVGTEMLLNDPDHGKIKGELLQSTFKVIDRYVKQTSGMSDYIQGNLRPYKFEDFRIRKYNKNEGFFKLHSDIIDYKSASRLFVIMFYLNSVQIGGETEFPLLDVKVKPRQGSCVIFPPSFLFPHQANIPISHHKYTVQTYLHYK